MNWSVIGLNRRSVSGQAGREGGRGGGQRQANLFRQVRKKKTKPLCCSLQCFQLSPYEEGEHPEQTDPSHATLNADIPDSRRDNRSASTPEKPKIEQVNAPRKTSSAVRMKRASILRW